MSTSTILSDNGVSSGTSGIKTSGGNDGTLVLQTTTAGGAATTALTIDTGQRTKFPTTIGVGDATPSTSGSGITFPATQSASTNANTLDDYEEGTWTPNIGGNTTYSAQSGKYIKIGRLVYITFKIAITTIGTGSAQVLSGLPFSGDGEDATISLTYYTDINTNVYSICAYLPAGNYSSLYFMNQSELDGSVAVNTSVFKNSTYVSGSGCYYCSG